MRRGCLTRVDRCEGEIHPLAPVVAQTLGFDVQDTYVANRSAPRSVSRMRLMSTHSVRSSTSTKVPGGVPDPVHPIVQCEGIRPVAPARDLGDLRGDAFAHRSRSVVRRDPMRIACAVSLR